MGILQDGTAQEEALHLPLIVKVLCLNGLMNISLRVL